LNSRKKGQPKFIYKLVAWTFGATLTAGLLVFSSLVTTTFQSVVLVSFGWIKLYTDLFNKMKNNKESELPDIS
jgi:hypothetical protein